MLKNSLPGLLDVSSPVNQVTLQIMNIQKYTKDATAELMIPTQKEGEQGSIYSLYDLTLCDTKYELKCVLHPNLNDMVEKREIEISGLVLVKNYKRIFDETKIGGGDPIVILTELTSLSEIEIDVKNTKKNKLNATEQQHIPLIGNRGYYVPLWNNDCFDCNHSSIFQQSIDVTGEETLQQLLVEQISFKEIQEDFLASQDSTLAFPTRSLIGRIIQKSQIHHFALKRDSHKPYQMKFEMQVAHGTSVINLTLWNRLCATYYYSLDVGMVIAIQRFRVQRNRRTGGIEICANSKSPKSIVHRLPDDFSFENGDELMIEDEEQEQTESLIDLRFIQLHTHKQWNISVPDDTVFDFAANITTVGRKERERLEPDSEIFLQYRWITAQDYLNPETEMVFKLYSCGKQSFFDHVIAGTQVLFYNIGIMSVWDNFRRTVFLRTLPDTQIFSLNHVINGNHFTHDSRSNIVRAANRNSKADEEGLERRWKNHELLVAQNFYPSTASVFPLCTDIYAHNGGPNSQFLFLKELVPIVDSLLFQEVKHVSIQGYINSIQLQGKVACEEFHPPRECLKLAVRIQNINKTQSILANALIPVGRTVTFIQYVNALVDFFPASLCKTENMNSLMRGSPTTMDATTAFYNFKHRVLDQPKLAQQLLSFNISLFRSSFDEVEVLLAPPKAISK